MWCEKTKNNKYKYGERYYNPLIKKYQKVSITLQKKDDRQAFKILQQKIDLKEKMFKNKNINITLGECITRYLDFKKKKVKPTTYNCIKYELQKFTQNEFNLIIVNEINSSILREMIESSLNNKYNVSVYLRTFMKWAYENDYIEDISFLGKIGKYKDNVKKRDDKILYLEKKEIQNILNKFNNMNLNYMEQIHMYLFEFQINTGLRFGEMVALTKNDIEEHNGVYMLNMNKTYSNKCLQKPKTEKSIRQIAINKRCVEIIKKSKILQLEITLKGYNIKNINNLLFCNTKGGYINLMTYNIFLDKLCEGLTSHKLRHTHASILAEENIPLEMIQRRLGHENDEITKKIYIHVTEKAKKRELEFFSNLNII